MVIHLAFVPLAVKLSGTFLWIVFLYEFYFFKSYRLGQVYCP